MEQTNNNCERDLQKAENNWRERESEFTALLRRKLSFLCSLSWLQCKNVGFCVLRKTSLKSQKRKILELAAVVCRSSLIAPSVLIKGFFFFFYFPSSFTMMLLRCVIRFCDSMRSHPPRTSISTHVPLLVSPYHILHLVSARSLFDHENCFDASNPRMNFIILIALKFYYANLLLCSARCSISSIERSSFMTQTSSFSLQQQQQQQSTILASSSKQCWNYRVEKFNH